MSYHFPVEPVYKSGSNGDFILVGDTVYVDTYGEKHLIPDGFHFSPSIPRLFTPFVPVTPDTIISSLPHDWFYQEQTVSRYFADNQWKSVLVDRGASIFTVQRSYYALRWGGWIAWNNNAEKKGIKEE